MEKNLQITNINGVDCYEQDGVAYLKLENVARGLGFTEIAASGNECVKWTRVRKYLCDLGIDTSVDGGRLPEFIPENIFYRLAMKAKNETAERFQALVADEIIPAIRKTGAYMTPAKIEEVLLNPDTIISLATQIKELQTKVRADAPKVLFAEAVETSQDSCLVGQLAKLIRQNGYDIGANRLFEHLRNEGYLCKSGSNKNMPTQRSMDAGWFEIKESTIENPDGSIRVVRTPKVTGKGQVYFINKFLA